MKLLRLLLLPVLLALASASSAGLIPQSGARLLGYTFTGGGASSFTTTFSGGNESPLSEGGSWLNGQADGTHWKNFQVNSGHACAAAFSSSSPPPYDDAIGILKASVFQPTANQYVRTTISVAGAYDPVGQTHERGHFMRFTLGVNTATGYEVYWSISNAFGIIRWDGPDSFAPLSVTGAGPAARPKNGDILETRIVGSTITVLVDSGSGLTQVASASDGTYTSAGQVGMQDYVTSGATLTSYCTDSFTAGNL